MFVAHGGLIPRNELLRCFDDLAHERVIFVCAPAGYGKTVIVEQWAEGRSHAMITLDEYDNNPHGFCRRFCAALLCCQPQNTALGEYIAQSDFPQAPEEQAMGAAALLSDRRSSVLIIDDLHHLHDGRTTGLLTRLLERLPACIQTILISREEPPGCLIERHGDMPRIGADCLRLSHEDVERLYQKQGRRLTTKETAEIMRLTGGWFMGICALLLKDGEGDTGETLDHYITMNIWSKWNDFTRNFMLRTALAAELHPSLCDTLAGITHSDRLLPELMQKGAFITRHDGGYHYQHLFRRFLQNRLPKQDTDFVRELLTKEGHWHLARGDFYNAVWCFIRCEHHDGIAQCFDLLERDGRNDFVVDKILPIIKMPVIQAAAEKYPSMYYLMAWAAYAEGRDLDMIRYMDRYYERYPMIAARTPDHAHHVIYLKLFDFRNSIKSMIDQAAVFPKQSCVKGVQGSITLNMPLFHRGICNFSELAAGDIESYINETGRRIGWLFGGEWDLLAECLAAGLLYEQGDIERAGVHAFSAVSNLRDDHLVELKFCAMMILVYVFDAQKRFAESELLLAKTAANIRRAKAYYLTTNFDALTTRRKLKTDGGKSARDWLARPHTGLYTDTSVYGIDESFTTARAHMALGNYDAAIILLTKICDLSKRFRRDLDLMEANILLAISHQNIKPSFPAKALRCLESAISIARPYGYTRLFVNERTELAELLRRVHEAAAPDSGDWDFINRLCLKISPAILSASHTPEVIFTDKQKTIMELLCQGMSYKDMAESMAIKLPTLRSHIALIYKKLDVSNENDAVRRIRANHYGR